MKQSSNTRSTSNTDSFQKTKSKMPTLGGISIAELAVLGAAGFVVWKNRDKIVSLLEDNGISTPSFLTTDLSELIRSGASAAVGANATNSLSHSSSSIASSRGRRQDA